MQQQVPGFAIFDAGISVHPKFPYLSATPDGKYLIHHQEANLDCWRLSALFKTRGYI